MLEIISTFLFLVINGLIFAFVMALIALGLSLIFGVMGIVNMAHGDMYMTGAVLSFLILQWFGNFWLSFLIAPLIVFLLCIPIERFALRPFVGRPAVTMIATVGLSYIIQQVALGTYGGIPRIMPEPWPVRFYILGVQYPGYRILVACISVMFLIALWIFLNRTSYGILVRASIQDAEMASAMGINSDRIFTVTFALGGGLAALGGVLAAPISQVSYLMGSSIILFAFIIVIVGGLGSLKGTLVASLLLSTIEGGMTTVLKPVEARVMIFIIMIVILAFRPRGLFGSR